MVLEERTGPDGRPSWRVVEGEAPGAFHLRALTWLLEEHGRAGPDPRDGSRTRVVLEIARTPMAEGRVGHRYAIGGGPVGDPRADGERGVLWRYAHARLAGAGEAGEET